MTGCSAPSGRRLPGRVISTRVGPTKTGATLVAPANWLASIPGRKRRATFGSSRARVPPNSSDALVYLTRSVIRDFSLLTRIPASRFDSFGAPFSQRSLICVSTPFLRAIQRSRNVFQSDSVLMSADSFFSAASSFSAALSSAPGEKSFNFGTVYAIFGDLVIPNGSRQPRAAVSTWSVNQLIADG